MELLDYIDPQTSLQPSMTYNLVKNSVRFQYLFHPYLIYKAFSKAIDAPVCRLVQEDGSDNEPLVIRDHKLFGGFFPISIGLQAAYMVRGRSLKVWHA